MQRLEQAGDQLQTTSSPLFGNPIVFGVRGRQLSGTASDELPRRLGDQGCRQAERALDQASCRACTRSGTHDGAKLYQPATHHARDRRRDGAARRLPAPVSSAARPARARRWHHRQPITRALLAGLPQDALVQVFGDLTQRLSAAERGEGAADPVGRRAQAAMPSRSAPTRRV